MENLSVSEIINRLLGKIIPVGETNEDNKRYENIQNYYEALSHIISCLRIASKYKDRPDYSVQKIGKECYDILKEFDIEEPMNNIEILEKLVERCKECKFACCEQCEINNTQVRAIENLIQENKKFKNKCNELNFKYTAEWVDDNFIPKSKVKAMLEGITKEHSSILSKDIYSLNDINIATFQYNAMRKILEELLEEGGNNNGSN